MHCAWLQPIQIHANHKANCAQVYPKAIHYALCTGTRSPEDLEHPHPNTQPSQWPHKKRMTTVKTHIRLSLITIVVHVLCACMAKPKPNNEAHGLQCGQTLGTTQLQNKSHLCCTGCVEIFTCHWQYLDQDIF